MNIIVEFLVHLQTIVVYNSHGFGNIIYAINDGIDDYLYAIKEIWIWNTQHY